MGRDSFIFYGSFFEALSCLDDDVRLQCYDAVIEYALTGNERELNGVPKAVFALIKPQIDANNERYTNGCKGGRPSSKTNGFEKEANSKTNGFENEGVLENQTITKHKPNENENDNENENENVNEKEKKNTPSRKFSKPSVDDVRAYCEERQNGIDPEAFVDFYESKGWKVGNQPMKDWKSAVRTWERRSGSSKPQEKPPDNSGADIPAKTYTQIHNFQGERTYDYDALMKEVSNV